MVLGDVRAKLPFWLKIARLQFYPMAFIAYSLGSTCAFVTSRKFNLLVYAVGYALLFLIEFCTILTNEYYDYDTDRLNKNFSSFTGGTRVLVDGNLQFHEVRTGILVALSLVIVFSYLLVRITGGIPPLRTIFLVVVGIFLGLGYTLPPFRFSYRGLGEIVVGGTHSTYLVLCGYTFQTGTWSHPLPWLLSIPLFFSVLAANTLAGFPDRLADMAVSKKTFAVIFGPKTAIVMASCFACMAVLAGVWIWSNRGKGWALTVEMVLVISHGVIILLALSKLIRSNNFDKRIDGMMALSLAYIIWFGIIPIISLLWIRNLS